MLEIDLTPRTERAGREAITILRTLRKVYFSGSLRYGIEGADVAMVFGFATTFETLMESASLTLRAAIMAGGPHAD